MTHSPFSDAPRCVAALLFLASSSARLAAQEIVLDRYYVSAPPVAGVGGETVSSSTLQSYPPVDVGSLLSREVASMAPVRRGGVATDVLLRGLGRDNVSVTLDGAPAFAACPGRMDPPVFHVSSPLIEHLVVSAGPFDVRRGGAPGGVIEVRTAPAPDHRFETVGGFAGTAGLVTVDAALGGPVGGAWRALGAFSQQTGRSYRDGSGVRITALPRLNYRAEAIDARAFSIVHAEAQARWRGQCGNELALRAAINDGRDVLYPALLMDAQRDRATRLGATYSATSIGPWAETWRVDLYHHRVEHDMSDARRTSSLGLFASRGWMMRTVAATTNSGAQFEAESRHGAVQLVTGAQLGMRHWVADNVIGAVANPMIPDVEVGNAAAYLQAERTGKRWTVRAGARLDTWKTAVDRDLSFAQRAHDTNQADRSDLALGGHVVVERRIGDGTAYAGLGHGARLPDPQERYTSVDRPAAGTDWVGNPQLDPVRGTELTLGGHRSFGRVHASARVFQLWLEDYVVLGRLAPVTAANPARTESYFGIQADISGAEARADITLCPEWTLVLDAAGQRGRKRTYAPGGGDRDLPDIPPWRGRGVLRWQRAVASIELESAWAARQNRVDASAGEIPVAGYGVVHARASLAVTEQFSVSAGVDNLFDRTYATHNAYTRDPFAAGVLINEPGRTLFVSARWKQ